MSAYLDRARGQDVIWVTGASSGIGYAVCLELARQGYRVAATARREELLDQLAVKAQSAGYKGEIYAYPCDVTDQEAVVQLIQKIEQEKGEIICAILNAGTHVQEPKAGFRWQDFETINRLNVLAPIFATHYLCGLWQSRRRGHVVFVSSVAGYRGLPGALSYCASKSGLITAAESLYFEARRWGGKVQVVNPGFVKTPLTDKNTFPMPFLMPVDKAAAALVRGLRKSRFEISFPWFFTWALRRLRCSSYALYFLLTRQVDPAKGYKNESKSTKQHKD